MKSIKTIISLLALISLFSCIKEDNDESPYDDETWSEINNLDQSKYYELQTPEFTGFDGALYHDGSYIAYKTDVENNVFVYFVSRKKSQWEDGVFVVLNPDGTLAALGQKRRMAYTCENNDGTLSLVGLDENNDLKLLVPNSASKQTVKGNSFNGKNSIKDIDPKYWIKVGLENVPYLKNLIDIYDLGNAWKGRDSFQSTVNIFATGVNQLVTSSASIPIEISSSDWSQDCHELLRRIYGDANPEIIEVTPIKDNKFEVTVKIRYAEDLAKPFSINLNSNSGNTTVSALRETYLAVYGSPNNNADLSLAIATSDKVLIDNQNGNEDRIMKVTVEIPGGKMLYLRPQLSSYLELPISQSGSVSPVKIFNNQFRYGSEYIYANGGINLSFKQKNLKGRSSSEYDPGREIIMELNVDAVRPATESSDIAVSDWGFVIINDKGERFFSHSFAQDNEANLKETHVNQTVEINFKEKDLTVDDNNYRAYIKDWRIYPFIKYVNAVDNRPIQDEAFYGEPNDFSFTYSEIPDLTYVATKYYTSYVRSWASGAWQPILINPDEKIYANCQTEFETTMKVKGAFFLNKAKYIETGTTKYCLLYENTEIHYFEDGNVIDGVDFLWKGGDFSNENPLSYHLEFTTYKGTKGWSNNIRLEPIKHVDDKGEMYYFGFTPSIH